MSPSTSGTVFDIGYRITTASARAGAGRGRAVFKDGVRIALGLGRGGRAKTPALVLHRSASGNGLILALIAGRRSGSAGPERRGRTCRRIPTSTGSPRSSCSSSPPWWRRSCSAGTGGTARSICTGAAAHRVGLHRVAWAGFLTVDVGRGLAAPDHPVARALGGRPRADGVSGRTTGSTSEVPCWRGGNGDCTRDPRDAHGLVHHPARLRLGVPRRLFVITRRSPWAGPGDRRQGRPVDLDVQPDEHPGPCERRDLRRDQRDDRGGAGARFRSAVQVAGTSRGPPGAVLWWCYRSRSSLCINKKVPSR